MINIPFFCKRYEHIHYKIKKLKNVKYFKRRQGAVNRLGNEIQERRLEKRFNDRE